MGGSPFKKDVRLEPSRNSQFVPQAPLAPVRERGVSFFLSSPPVRRGRAVGGEGGVYSALGLTRATHPLTPTPLPRVQGRGASGTDSHSGSSQGTRRTQTIRTIAENGTPTRTKSPNV